MINNFLKLGGVTLLGLLDVSLFSLWPYLHTVSVAVSFLILALFLAEPLFFKMSFLIGMIFALLSQWPWYIFLAFFLLWAWAAKKVFNTLFLNRSVFSLLLLYIFDYALFVLIFAMAGVISGLIKHEAFSVNDLWPQLTRGGLGLLIGSLLVTTMYLAIIYFSHKFSSLFFVKQRQLRR